MKKISKLIESIKGEYVAFIGVGIAVTIILAYNFLIKSIF
jgi:hypothetical protein